MVVGLLSACCSAGAEGETFWSFLPANATIIRCAEGSEDQKAAEAAWRGLDTAIQRLTDDAQADAAAARQQLEETLKLRCFHLAVENGALNLPTHPTALKAWWQDGGDSWLWSYIDFAEAGPINALRPQVALPPDARRVLFRETSTASGLAPLLCSQSDPSCGRETRGWLERARRALSAPGPMESSGAPEKRLDGPDCEKENGKSAYSGWRACLNDVDERKTSMPLGRTRAPREGWLVVEGRRGHYTFCDGVAAYHLGTGAAYRAESCSGLALLNGGHVDHEATDAGRSETFRFGSVPIDNLREATWMLLLKDETEEVHPSARYFDLPRDVAVRFDRGGSVKRRPSSRAFSWSTGQTRLRWGWANEYGEVLAEGSVTWPTSDDPADRHAGELLDVAERGLDTGCPAAAVPATLPSQGANLNVVIALALAADELPGRLWKTLREYQPEACAAAD
jgi:hypothetical protein